MNKRIKHILIYALPFIAALISAVLYFAIPESGKQKQMKAPYYMCFLLAAIIVLAICLNAGIFKKNFTENFRFMQDSFCFWHS